MNIKNIKSKEFCWPRGYCVYFLTDQNGEILYVGKTNRMHLRIGENAYRKKFDKVFYIECANDKEASKTEIEFIVKAQAKYNTRLDDPESIGFLTTTRVRSEAKAVGKNWNEVRKIVQMENVKTIEVAGVKYFEKGILRHLKQGK